MTTREGQDRFSLKRWSQRKLESGAKPSAASPPTPSPNQAGAQAPAVATSPPPAAPGAATPVELPPIDSLTFDSDFTVFLKPEVAPALQRAALKRLFRDPRFNVMDGLDTYIDDYTKPDPIPPEMLAELVKRFDFTPTPAPVAAAGANASSESREGTARAVAPGASDPAADARTPSHVDAIPDARPPAAAQSATTVPAQPEREAAVARDPSIRAGQAPSTSSGQVPSTSSGEAERR